MKYFQSKFERVGDVRFPDFHNIRVLMMPVILGDPCSLPVLSYKRAFEVLCSLWPNHLGSVGYITIGQTHRRPGKHVDGVLGNLDGAWGGDRNGMLLAASHPGCVAWEGLFHGSPGPEGQNTQSA